MSNMKNLSKFVLLAANIITAIFIIASTSGNAWLKNDVTTKGLWKSCPYSSCVSFNRVDVWHKTCQALSVVACLLTLVATILAILELIIDRMFVYFISTSIFLSGIFMVTCLALYTHFTLDSDLSYGWAFIVGWIGMVCGFVSACYGFILERYLSDEKEHIVFGWKHVSSQDPNSYVIGL